MGRPNTIETSTMRKVFVDTGAYIALAHRDDQHHADASRTLRALSVHHFVTTDHVIGETYTWLRYKVGSPPARAFLTRVRTASEQRRLTVVFTDASLLDATQRVLERFADQALSFTDGVSLALLERDGSLTGVFAFDAHLILAGRPMHPGPK